MVVRIRLQCPECANKFYAVSMCPDCCPKCGYVYEPPDDTVISMPAIRSAVSKAADQTYRDMETASERRAEMAAQAAGVPVSEMSGLKITNLRDNTKPGEDMAPAVVNDVTKHMDSLQQRGGQFGFVNGSEFAAGTAQGAINVNGRITTGIEPRAGARALGSIQRMNGSR